MSVKLPALAICNTSPYSGEAVRLCCDWALRSVSEVDGRLTKLERVWVRVTGTATCPIRGRAFQSAGRVLLRIGNPTQFPTAPRRYWTYRHNEDFPLQHHDDWVEGLVGLAAHEFFHLHDRELYGSKPRDREFRAETAEDDALQYLRTHRAEFDAELDAIRHKEAARESAKRSAVSERQALLNSPEHKLHLLLEVERTWLRKQKLATTKLKKVRTRIKRLQGRIQKVQSN